MNLLSDPLIMLVDDNEIDLFINKKLLVVEEVSKNHIAFDSPNVALDYLNDNITMPYNLPDIILLDIHMPEMNGFEFLHYFSEMALPDKDKIMIYILSSTGDPGDIEKGRKNAFVKDVLFKPLDIRLLRKSLIKHYSEIN